MILILALTFKGYAQTSPEYKLTEKDSLEIINELMQLLEAGDDPVSFVFANVGIGNRLYSLKNNAFNAFQSTATKIVYSPSLGYFHKSGFGLTVGASLLNGERGFGVNQYSLSPSYDLHGNEHIAFNISYAHYFVKDKYSAYSSPIQNDFYTAFTYKKNWLQPGIALGYATGEYKEAKYLDTIVAGNRRHFYDSINYKLNAFSMMLSVSHEFDWYNILDKSDGLSLTPTLVANAGSGKTTIGHKTNATRLFNRLNKKGRISKLQNNEFAMQSIGLNITLGYNIGSLSFVPQFYVDYYLPAIDPGSNRITQVCTFNIGYSF